MRTEFVLAVTLLWPLASRAADIQPLNVKLGLWETVTTNQTTGAPPIPAEALERMPPEQRAKVEAAMKARGAMGPQTHTYRNCITKEDLEKAFKVGEENEKTCKKTVTSSSRTSQDIRIECATPNMSSAGDVHVEAADSEHTKGSANMRVTSAGRTMEVKSTFAYKWVSASCPDTNKK